MSDVTQILSRIDRGDPSAAAELLPLVYEELRTLAATRMADERPGQTLQATALVHEAYLRLVDGNEAQHWNSRGHFFAAAAESMRRILVDRARQRRSLKQGGDRARQELHDSAMVAMPRPFDLLALDEALSKLQSVDPRSAELVKLRYFGGFTIPEAAEILDVSTRTANEFWTYARAWLTQELGEKGD